MDSREKKRRQLQTLGMWLPPIMTFARTQRATPFCIYLLHDTLEFGDSFFLSRESLPRLL